MLTRTPDTFMQDQWQPNLHYHIIGKAVPDEILFDSPQLERWFLKHTLRFKLYHLFSILSYCLCVNHFHLCVRTRTADEIRASLLGKPERARSQVDAAMLAGDIDYPSYVHHASGGALSGFARHVNAGRSPRRHGQLLLRPTLHGLTDKGPAPGSLFSRRLCAYVGLNFVKHHLGQPGDRYPASSLTNPQFQIVDHGELFALFGGQRAYIDYHNTYLSRHGRRFYARDENALFAALRPRYFDPATRVWVEGEWEPTRID